MSQKRRKQVRCTLCTPHRWLGNGKERFKGNERAARREHRLRIRETTGS